MKANRLFGLVSAFYLMAGCAQTDAPAHTPAPIDNTLRIGLGDVASSDEQAGIRQIVRNVSTEFLLNYGRDGRPIPVLASNWTRSGDGLSVKLTVRSATFHDGSPVTAAIIQGLLERGLPRLMGPAYDDVEQIHAISDQEIEIRLKRTSPFPLEALDLSVLKPGSTVIGTGPFQLVESARTDGRAELIANTHYHLGTPAVGRIVLRPYPSIRSAWADLLRGNVDMLYEVSDDALDSLEPSSRVKVFSYPRHYLYVVLFNFRNPALQRADFRRRLNAAVNKAQLVADGLGSRGTPADGPVWPDHWANSAQAPGFTYAPERISGAQRIHLRCIIGDPSHERLAIALQRQLQSVGVDLDLELVGVQEALKRLDSHDFDLLLTEAIGGPSLLRPYLFWHSKGPYNYGGYSSPEVDTALDTIRHAPEDDAYRAGVAAFQRAVVDDPPAIFLAWSLRARAVSTAFDVEVEPGRDPLSTLRLWRPAGSAALARGN